MFLFVQVSGLQTQILLSLGNLCSQFCETQKMLITMVHDNAKFLENNNNRMTNVEHNQQLQLQQVTVHFLKIYVCFFLKVKCFYTDHSIVQDLTHGEQHFPRKRYIEVEYPTTIGKRVRGVNGRAVVSNKKFDCYKRCLVDDKDDFDFVCTTEERHIMLRILSAKPTEKIIHINDVVLTKADFECLLQAYPYDHYEKNISTKVSLCTIFDKVIANLSLSNAS